MKKLNVSRVMFAVAVFAAAVVWAKGDAEGAPPAWIVSSTGTVARAEAGDAGAMEEIANGYLGLARSSNTESTDDERIAMILEATKWMHRRAKVIVKTSEVQARAEKDDEAAMMDLARSYLCLAAARTMEAKGEERKAMFQKAMEWLRLRAEKTMAQGNTDAITAVSEKFMDILGAPEYDFNDEERDVVFGEVMRLLRRRAKIMADREGDVDSVRKRAADGDPAAQRVLGFRYSHGIDVEKDEKKAFEWTKKAAEQGDAKAVWNLANDYANGNGVTKDKEKAVKWYRKAVKAFQALAEKGEKFDLRPLCNVGQELLEDEFLHAPDVGMQFLEIAARCGDAEGMRLYGEQFAIGKAVDEDINEALLWLRKASRRGDEDVDAIIDRIHEVATSRLLQKLHDKAEAGDKEAAGRFNECMKLYKQSLTGEREIGLIECNALAGYVPAQAQLGLAYMLGKSVAQDKAKGVEWLRKAADQGEYRAMYWLGIAYEHGDGVAKDDWRAYSMWKKSNAMGWDDATEKLWSLLAEYRGKAENGDASAQFFVGVAYEGGSTNKPNAAKAVEWYRKAAEQGHPGAQAFLGWALQNGLGTEKNLAEAVSWYRKAAKQGNPEGQLNLGKCLFYGEGCKENEQEAVSWYRKAAEQGETSAMFNLGACYMDGTGVKKDIAEATKWFRRAASLGHERSAKLLEDLQKNSAR